MNAAVFGLGYVGLPLAVALAAHRPVVGFDINTTRIETCWLGKTRCWRYAPVTDPVQCLRLTNSVSSWFRRIYCFTS